MLVSGDIATQDVQSRSKLASALDMLLDSQRTSYKLFWELWVADMGRFLVPVPDGTCQGPVCIPC